MLCPRRKPDGIYLSLNSISGDTTTVYAFFETGVIALSSALKTAWPARLEPEIGQTAQTCEFSTGFELSGCLLLVLKSQGLVKRYDTLHHW